MQTGKYAAVRFSLKTLENLKRLVFDLNIPSRVPSAKMHTTVCYSRTPVPDLIPLGVMTQIWYSDTTSFLLDVWDTRDGKRALVLRYSCVDLAARHHYIRDELGASYDYEEYLPHITLSYDVGEWKPPVEIISFADNSHIEIVEEYAEDLVLDWADKITESLIERDGEWFLVSKNSGRVLRKYGSEKPSDETVKQDEEEIRFFKTVKE